MSQSQWDTFAVKVTQTRKRATTIFVDSVDEEHAEADALELLDEATWEVYEWDEQDSEAEPATPESGERVWSGGPHGHWWESP